MPPDRAAPALSPVKRALGINFYDGSVTEAVTYLSQHGGLVVAPAAPSFVALERDPAYRRAIADADLALEDSGAMALFWRCLHGEKLTRISGLAFFQALLASPEARIPRNFFWILPSAASLRCTLEFAEENDYPLRGEDCYVAPQYHGQAIDPSLVSTIDSRKPRHIIIAIGGGMQDKLGRYLKNALSYRPGIYCMGAAPGFVTGDQVRIPRWADRLCLGWMFRVISHPRLYLGRYWDARRVPLLIARYGREMPPLVTRELL